MPIGKVEIPKGYDEVCIVVDIGEKREDEREKK